MNEKDTKLLDEARKRFDQAEEAEREDRELADLDLAFAAGEQWPDLVKQERKNRPCLTINRLPQFIQQIVGEARQNAPAIKVHPVDSGADPDVAKIYQGLIRNIESQSSAQSAYMTALEHAVTCSFGHWRIVTEYSDPDSFDQDIRIKRITSPFAVSWDPNAKEYDKSDANWCFVHEWVTKEYFEETWPNATPSDWEAEYRQIRGYAWRQNDRVRIAEYWKKVPKKKTIALLQNGEVVDVTELKDFVTVGMIPVVKTKTVMGYEIKCWKLSGHAVLEGPYEYAGKYIPIVSVFGPEEFISDRVRHRSLIRYAIDAQRMYNYWQSTITEKIALAPKAPFIGTVDQFSGHEAEWDRANIENRSRLTYNSVPGIPPPQRSEPAYVNQAEIIQAGQAIDDMKATMGIYDASLGNKGNETSGRAIMARQKQGDTGNFAFIDNLARSIQHTGRILIDLIPKIYDTSRVVRVLGPDDSADMVPINQVVGGQMINDLSVGKYDVVVEVGPSYATKRLEAAESMMTFINAFPAAAGVAGDLIAKAMDWPGAEELGARLRKLLPPGMEDPSTMRPEEQQAYMASKQKAEHEQQIIKEMEVAARQEEIKKLTLENAKIQAEVEKLNIENTAVMAGLSKFGPEAHTQVDNIRTEAVPQA